MPVLYPLFEMLNVAEETKKFQKVAQEALLNRPIDLTQAQDSTMHSRSADPKPRYQKLAEVPGEDASEAEVLQTLEVIKNSLDQNKDDAAMLLALKNNSNLKSKFLAHAKCQRMTEAYQRMSYYEANVKVIDSFVEQVQSEVDKDNLHQLAKKKVMHLRQNKTSANRR